MMQVTLIYAFIIFIRNFGFLKNYDEMIILWDVSGVGVSPYLGVGVGKFYI